MSGLEIASTSSACKFANRSRRHRHRRHGPPHRSDRNSAHRRLGDEGTQSREVPAASHCTSKGLEAEVSGTRRHRAAPRSGTSAPWLVEHCDSEPLSTSAESPAYRNATLHGRRATTATPASSRGGRGPESQISRRRWATAATAGL